VAVDSWANRIKRKICNAGFKHLEDIAVLSARKESLKQLADFLVQREH
jgi:geranylgeranyl diphosphate synthase type II